MSSKRRFRLALATVSFVAMGCGNNSGSGPSDDSGVGDQNGDGGNGTGDPVPEAPSNLTITPTCSGLVLGWRDNSSNETGFAIYRQQLGLDSGPKYVASVGSNVVSYTDSSVEARNIYFYKVHSRNGAGESLLFTFESATAIGVPKAATNLSVMSVSPGMVRLMWVDYSDDETGFEVRQRSKRCDRPWDTWTPWTPVMSVGPNQTQALIPVIDGLPLGYYFAVYAKNGCGYSAISNQARWGPCS